VCDEVCYGSSVWLSKNGCADTLYYFGKYDRIGADEGMLLSEGIILTSYFVIDDGYIHETGNTVLYRKEIVSGYRKIWVVSDVMDGEAIVLLGSGSCPTGQYNHIKVENHTRNAAQCICDQATQDTCTANCATLNEGSVCKCISSGWDNGQCVSCSPGQDFASVDSATCVDIPCDDQCNKHCIDNPNEYNECKCISTGFGDQCVTCPPGQN